MDHISHVKKSLEAEAGAGVVEHPEVEVGMEGPAAMVDLGSWRHFMGDTSRRACGRILGRKSSWRGRLGPRRCTIS